MSTRTSTVNQTGAGPHRDSRLEGREVRGARERRAVRESFESVEDVPFFWEVKDADGEGSDLAVPGLDGRVVATFETPVES